MNDYLDNVKKSKTDDVLFAPEQGLIYGTMFKTLVEPYKNLKPVFLAPKNEQDRAMLDVQMYEFACHDLGLYLDVFPNEKTVVDLRKQCLEMYEKAKKEYDSMYPPFCKTAKEINKIPFPWSTTPFPWGDK